jgi:hypothetical protein
MAKVWVRWINAGQVYQSVFDNADDAQAQAEAEPHRGHYLGIYDGPLEDDSSKQVGDLKGVD